MDGERIALLELPEKRKMQQSGWWVVVIEIRGGGKFIWNKKTPGLRAFFRLSIFDTRTY